MLREQVERGGRRHDLVEEFVSLVRSGALITVPGRSRRQNDWRMSGLIDFLSDTAEDG